jgi:GNAT superfamily N-acetyltransferase
VRIRDGEATDVATVLSLMDEAVRWLVARGQTGQWGSEPISGRESFIERVEAWQDAGGLRIAETDGGEPVGALVVGEKHPFIRDAGEPELYVDLLVTSRRHAGEGVGSALVRQALDEARAAGVELVRVDCWAGAPTLVAWYERQGFVPVERFRVGEWKGQLFELRIAELSREGS